MGFIHHTTGATGATGLMVESAPTRGSVSFEQRHPLATGLPGRPISVARIGDHLPCNADRAAALGVSPSGREAARPIPATRFRSVKGQNH
jgi:hypothetical protein